MLGKVLKRAVEKGLTLHRYWDLESCRACAIKPKCTTSLNRRIMRWEHEEIIEAMQRRMDLAPGREDAPGLP